ncbi:MAG: hypothetical protein LBU60_06350 [Clostridiales bacterium]|jgi:hypothetical protein|nr:hypothetical protein [Clostridiales bacterium]
MYWVVEFVPCGFLIYDGTLTQVLEKNAKANSPWHNLDGDFIYGGATNYYVMPSIQPREGYLYQHTVIEETLQVDEVQNQVLVADSVALNANIVAGIEQRTIQSKGYTQNAKINRRDVVLDTDTDRFNINGNCGYVAGAIIAWHASQVTGDSRYAPKGFNRQFVEEIQNGWANDSYSDVIALALFNYFARMSSFVPRMESGLIPLLSTLFDIVNRGKPVILFARMDRPDYSERINHAITIHQIDRQAHDIWFVQTYDNYWINAHYGWDTLYNNHWAAGDTFLQGSRLHIEY